MPTMTPELREALEQVTRMTHPSIPKLLKLGGFKYEAEAIEKLTEAYLGAKNGSRRA